jgi:Ca2+-binding EF-hand superfamily protein
MNLESDEQTRRLVAVDQLFREWDLNGDGFVSYSELIQILQASQRLGTKEQSKWVKRLEAQIAQGKGSRSTRSGSVTSLSMGSDGGVINFSEVTGEPSLDPVAFASLLKNLTEKNTPKEFDDFVHTCRDAVREASQATQGTKTRREIWEMFQALDTTHSGNVLLEDFEAIIGDTHKKTVLRWKHYLRNKAMERKTSNLQIKKEGSDDPLLASGGGTSGLGAAIAAIQSNRASFCFESVDAGDLEESEIDDRLSVTLPDFQKFMTEVEKSNSGQYFSIRSMIEKTLQERQVRYILNLRVADIMNDVMEDLLKERPLDVLAGIAKSVERLRRSNKYPVQAAPPVRKASL